MVLHRPAVPRHSPCSVARAESQCSLVHCSVLQPSSIRGLATPWTYFLHLSLSSVILIDSSTGSPVHVLMLSIQAVHGLPRLRAPGIVPSLHDLFLQATPLFPHGVTTLVHCRLWCAFRQQGSSESEQFVGDFPILNL